MMQSSSAVASCSYSRAAGALIRPAPRSVSRTTTKTMTHAKATAQPLRSCRRRQQQQLLNLRPSLVASASSTTAEKEPPRNKTVADIMTKGVCTVTADTTVDEGAFFVFENLLLRSD